MDNEGQILRGQIAIQGVIKDGEDWRICSACGAGHMVGHQYANEEMYHKMYSNFCPNCGTDMREVTE